VPQTIAPGPAGIADRQGGIYGIVLIIVGLLIGPGSVSMASTELLSC
jgi:hypothetical protein